MVFIIILVIGIIISTLTIQFFIRAYRIQNIAYPIVSKSFFDMYGNYIKERANKFRSSKKAEFNRQLIEDYLFSIKDNETIIQKKAKNILTGQYFFLVAILSISVVIVTALVMINH